MFITDPLSCYKSEVLKCMWFDVCFSHVPTDKHFLGIFHDFCFCLKHEHWSIITET